MGIPHPDFLLDVLTARQWTDWVEFASVEPIGPEREDYQAATTAAIVAGCWAEKPPKIGDCKIDWLGETKRASVDDILRGWAASQAAWWDSRDGQHNR